MQRKRVHFKKEEEESVIHDRKVSKIYGGEEIGAEEIKEEEMEAEKEENVISDRKVTI